MATTTNYSWSTPDDTALVKDGAAAIRSLGTAIDTTVFNNAGAAIAKTIVDAKGDLIAATAADTVARLAVGTNGQVLKADSTTATGLAWGTIAAGGKVLQVVQATSSTQVSKANESYADAMSVAITPSSSSSKVLLMFSGNIYMNGANTLARGRFTRGGTTILDYNGFQFNATGSGDEFASNPYCTYLDSPATTSETTYAFQFNRAVADSGSVIFNLQQDGMTQRGIFIVMEIGA
jgi:hypothetical protein